MKKIYFKANHAVFCSPQEVKKLMANTSYNLNTPKIEGYKTTNSASETKLELISNSTKPILYCGDDWVEKFAEFCRLFSQTIDAGGGVVTNPKDDVLMIYRNGFWDLPKGKLELDETIEECALREVEEECGISDLQLGDFIAQTYHIYRLHSELVIKKSWFWKMSYRGVERLVPQKEEGITGIEWVAKRDLPSRLADSYGSVQEVFSLLLTS